MEKNKRTLNLKFSKAVVHEDELEGEREFINTGNVQFFKLKSILFFFLELHIDTIYTHNKMHLKRYMESRTWQVNGLGAVDSSLESTRRDVIPCK